MCIYLPCQINMRLFVYSWTTHQLDIGTPCVITFAVEARFQTRHQFWNPQPKLNGAWLLGFFCKTLKHARLTSRQVLGFHGGFRHKIDPLSSILFLLSRNYRSCHLYARAFNYRAHAHQLDSLKQLKKSERTKAPQKVLRPLNKSIQRDKSYPAVYCLFALD